MKVTLTRNLGKELASAAGIDHAKALEGTSHDVTEAAKEKLGANAVLADSVKAVEALKIEPPKFSEAPKPVK